MPRSTRVSPIAAHFGAVIHRLRVERGWSLAQLAQRSGMNPTYLGVLEKGGNMPSLITILALADIFNIEAAEIVREADRARRGDGPAKDESS